MGQIEIEFDARLPGGGRYRKLMLENRHLRAIAAYQVNCLVPSDPRIRIEAQKRNYSQSIYQLEYEDTGAWAGHLLWISPLALLLFVRLPLLWGQRRRVTSCYSAGGNASKARE